MYLTDLAFIEEGTPNFTEEGLVNFSKMRMVGTRTHVARSDEQMIVTLWLFASDIAHHPRDPTVPADSVQNRASGQGGF